MNHIFISDTVPEQEKKQFELLFKVLDYDEENSTATICNRDGVIVAASQIFFEGDGFSAKDWVGKSIYDLQKGNFYKPSIAARVLKDKRRMTLIHKNPSGRDVITTSVPIFEDGTDEIKYVVSFAAINIQNEYGIQEQVNDLKNKLKEYKKKLCELEGEKLNPKELMIFGRKMQQIKETCEHIAKVDANILITGESGVGKNVIAKFIHERSNRHKESFVEINCGAIPENLIESELFGYEKGAFTGASDSGKKGLIEMANGGTLFLDEIGELPMSTQTKLLSTIQTKKVLKIGSTKEITVDFRLIAATNKDLKDEIEQKRFREDLFYRLNVIPIFIHPLRERRDEIEYMTQYFLDKFNRKYEVEKHLSEKTMLTFLDYYWPGNIRELENLIERLVVITKGNEIEYGFMQDEVSSCGLSTENAGAEIDCQTLHELMEQYERNIILQAYQKLGSSVRVGKALGIAQTTASKKIRQYSTQRET